MLEPAIRGSGVSREWLLASWCASRRLSSPPSSESSPPLPPPPPGGRLFCPDEWWLPCALELPLALLLLCPAAPLRPVPWVEALLGAGAGPDSTAVSPACGCVNAGSHLLGP